MVNYHFFHYSDICCGLTQFFSFDGRSYFIIFIPIWIYDLILIIWLILELVRRHQHHRVFDSFRKWEERMQFCKYCKLQKKILLFTFQISILHLWNHTEDLSTNIDMPEIGLRRRLQALDDDDSNLAASRRAHHLCEP